MNQEKADMAFNRRKFLKGSVAGAAVLAGLSLVGCSENKIIEDDSIQPNSSSNPEEGAEWHAVQCWHNCGGRCLNKVLMKEGVVIRQKTGDTHEDSWDWPQARGCIRGRSQQQKVFGADRLKYPMKRKNWSPDNPNGQLRGIDEWERISWDEALDYIADELIKAKEKYGNESIMYQNIIMLEGYLGAVLAQFGGYTDVTSADSFGTYQFMPQMYGFAMGEVNDRYDLEESEYIVLYGHNVAWAEYSYAYNLRRAHDKGVKFIFVGPEYNVSASVFDAQWFPVRQGTDTAFLLGVAYSMLEQDETEFLIDWDFLNKCTVGFDAEHMPADASTNENFRDYIMGAYDGIPKTPTWASEICGCPEDKIAEFARIVGFQNKVSFHSCCAPARNKGAENLPQLTMTVGCMGAHFGKPGHAWGSDAQYNTFDRGATLLSLGAAGYEFTANPFAYENPVTNIVPSNEMWSAVLDGKYRDGGSALMGLREMEEREIDIHVIISEQHNRLQTNEGINKGIEAYRKVDFVCSQAYWFKTDCVYSDIVLPITTRWERQMWNFMAYGATTRDFALAYEKVVEPMYEAKSDLWIARELAIRLGVDPDKYLSISDEQGWFNCFAGAIAMKEDGSYGPLLTITQETIDKYEVEGEPQEGIVDFDEFVKTGIYRHQSSNDGLNRYIAFKDFVEDPEKNPLETTSGKFEIYCQTKLDYFDSANRLLDTYTSVSPLPKYLPTLQGYVESFEDWERKTPGRYPYLISNSHYLRRAHTDHDNVLWTREAMTQPIFISKKDAQEKGVETGDVVRVWNDNGEVLRPASVTRCLMPGCLELPHGAAVQIDPESGIDLAGADNVLCSPNMATCVANNGWNNTLVNFEKYAGSIELLPDYEWEQRIPLAE